MTVAAVEPVAASAVGDATGAGMAVGAGEDAASSSSSRLASRRAGSSGGGSATGTVRKHFTGSAKQGGTRAAAGKRSSGGTAKRSKGKSTPGFPKLSTGKGSGPKVSTLIVEWLIAMLLIFWSVLSGQKGYLEGMQNALWRMTALSGVFFVLALTMRGKNTARVAVAFGLLIDLAMLLQTAKDNELKMLADIFAQKGTGGSSGGTVTATATSSLGAAQSPDTGPVNPTVHHFGSDTVSQVTHASVKGRSGTRAGNTKKNKG